MLNWVRGNDASMLCRYAVGVGEGDAVGDAGDALVPPLLHRIPATCLTPGFTLPWIIGMHQSQEDWPCLGII